MVRHPVSHPAGTASTRWGWSRGCAVRRFLRMGAAGAKWFGYPAYLMNRAGDRKEALDPVPDHSRSTHTPRVSGCAGPPAALGLPPDEVDGFGEPLVLPPRGTETVPPAFGTTHE